MIDCEVVETDVLVVGLGAAGTIASIRAHDEGVNVLAITSGALGKDSAVTWMTGGGFQVALYPPDSPEIHAENTIKAGHYLSHQELVYALLREAPHCISDLESWGERFFKKSGRFVQYFLPGHNHARCLLREKEKGLSNFGIEHHKVLPHQISQRDIPILEDFLVVDLLSVDGSVVGAVGFDLRTGEFKAIKSKVVILANGGYSACYKHYLTGPSVTGWGLGMAYRVGAEFIDMEFIDYSPYVAVWPKIRAIGNWPTMVRYGLSAKLYNKLGFEFWESYRRKGLTRIQAIFKEVEAGRGSPHGGVYLAVNHLPASLIENYLKQQRGAKWCTGLESIGFDLSREAIEVYISVLSTLGGCNIDAHCKTNVPGLFAAGELASGFDGAHTLAGNMMTMCFASGSIAGRAAAEEAKVRQQMEIDEQQVQELHSKLFAPLEHDNGVRPFEVKRQIREIMWGFCNVAGRTKEGLETAIKEIETMKVEKLPQLCPHAKNKQFNLEWLECIEIENMLTVCEMTLRAALTRTESRGLHFREDFPQLDPNFTKSIIISKERERMSVKTEQVAFPYLKPKGEQR